MTTYKNFVQSKVKPGQGILDSLTPEKCELWHMATGVSTEAGELLDPVKKHVCYNKPLDVTNIREECGDLLFYIQGVLNILDVELSEVIDENVDKLSKRYKGKYSDKEAHDRADKLENQELHDWLL